MKILVSNDDGVYAPGLHALQKELKQLGEVWVVAPLEEKSTSGHSLTIHKPLRLVKMGERFYGSNGSPADSVYLGIREVLKEHPDLVVSGVNRGANMGQDVYYSGTISAAREACILGIRSMAVSLSIDFNQLGDESEIHFSSGAKLAVKLIRQLKETPLPQHTLFNLNVPDSPPSEIQGVRLTRQGHRYYSGTILKRQDHRGRDYYWVGGQYQGFHEDPDTDCDALQKGYAALTPIQLDTTDQTFLEELKNHHDKIERL